MATLRLAIKSLYDDSGSAQTIQALQTILNLSERINISAVQSGGAGGLIDSIPPIPQETIDSYSQLAEVSQKIGVRGVQSSEEMNASLQNMEGYLQRITTALSSSAPAANRFANAQDDLNKKTRQGGQEVEQAGPLWEQYFHSFGGAFDLINRAGFALFLVTQNIKSAQMLVEGLMNTLQASAQALDAQRAFVVNAQRMGEAGDELRRSLAEAGQYGVIPLTNLQQKYNEVVRAGRDDLADYLPTLAELTILLSQADLTQAATNFDSFTNALIRGQSEQLKSLGIILDVESAYDDYREKLGLAANEQLNAEQKAIALTDAIKDLEGQIRAQNPEIETATKGYLQLSEAIDIYKKGIGQALAFGAGEIFGQENVQIEKFVDNVAMIGEHIVRAFAEVGVYGREVVEIFQAIGLRGEAVVLRLRSLWEDYWGNTEKAEELFAEFERVNEEARRLEEFDLDDVWEASDDAARRFRETVIGVTEDTEELVEASGKLPGIYELLTTRILRAQREGIRGLRDGLSEYIDDIEQYIEGPLKLAEDVAEAFEDMNERIAEVNADLADKLIEIQEDLADKIADINERESERLAEINEDLQKDLADLADDYREKRQDADEEFYEDREKLEEDHQRRIQDIMDRFERSRLKALIDRDARALWEAERARDDALKDEQQSYEDKRDEAQENYEEELDDLREAEEKKRQELEEQAQERREEAQEQAEKDREQARENAEKQRQDAKEAARKARDDAKKAYQEREQDLKDSYEERVRETERGEFEKRLKELESQEITEDNLEQHLDDLKEWYEEYFTWLQQHYDNIPEYPFPEIPTLPGDGDDGGGDDGGGDEPPPPLFSDPCVDGSGGQCQSRNQTRTCSLPNGGTIVYVCGPDYRWRVLETTGATAASPALPGGGFAPAFASPSGGGGGVNVRLVTEDKSLQAILDEVVSGVFIEIMES